MTPRALAAGVLLLLTVSCDTAPTPALVEDGPGGSASAPTRWVEVRRPTDASLLESPAVARAEEATGEVAALVPVQVLRLHARVGSRVTAGDPVVDVTSLELVDAAASYRAATEAAAAETARAEELEALRGEGLAVTDEVFERRATARARERERALAAGRLRALGVAPRDAAAVVRRGAITLSSPVDGVLVALHARVGEIQADGPLAVIRGEADARVEVRPGGAWPAAAALAFVAFDGRRVALQPEPIASMVDPEDGTTAYWYAPVDATALPDGLAGAVQLAPGGETWEVPARALAQRTGRSELLRRRGEAVERVTVEVLASSGASAIVRGPLEVGDRIAAEIAALADVEGP
jgi:cobalt-zinc-cadmium efflux system membrane fusion protein